MVDFQLLQWGILTISKQFLEHVSKVIGVESDKQCWYLILYLYAFFGIIIQEQNVRDILFSKSNKYLWYEVDFEEKQFMDVLFFGAAHVGVILNEKQFINPGSTVSIQRFKNNTMMANKVKVYRLWHY